MRRFEAATFALLGILALLAGAAAPAVAADTTTVTASGFAFTPPDVTIQMGDTVHWMWVSGSHTVTSGTGAADPNVGALFNASLNITSPDFYVTFGELAGTDSAGVYPFHCTPHEFLGMTGTVTVEALQVGIPAPEYADASWGELKSLFIDP